MITTSPEMSAAHFDEHFPLLPSPVHTNQMSTLPVMSTAPIDAPVPMLTSPVCANSVSMSMSPVCSNSVMTPTMSTSLLRAPIMVPSPRSALLRPALGTPYSTVVSNPSAQYRLPTLQNSVSSSSGLSPAEAAIHNSMINLERRSIRLVCPYKEGYIYGRDEIIWAITNQGLPKTAIQGIGQMEKNRIWEVLFTTTEWRDRIAHLDSLQTPEATYIKVFPITGNVAHIKVFWVPLCVPNALISQAIINATGRNGGNVKILSGQNQKVKDRSENIMYESAVRSFKAEVSDKNLIPHIMTINIPGRDRPTRILITVAGREPMCLKCKQIGHHRSECKLDKDDSRWCSICAGNVGHSTNDCDERSALMRSMSKRNEENQSANTDNKASGLTHTDVPTSSGVAEVSASGNAPNVSTPMSFPKDTSKTMEGNSFYNPENGVSSKKIRKDKKRLGEDKTDDTVIQPESGVSSKKRKTDKKRIEEEKTDITVIETESTKHRKDKKRLGDEKKHEPLVWSMIAPGYQSSDNFGDGEDEFSSENG